MANFRNDYSDVAHPKILEALSRGNEGLYEGYGFDEVSEKVRLDLKKKTGGEVFFLPGGTITNALPLTISLRPYEAIVAADTGHIVGHEAGAIEGLGHEIICVPSVDGKISPFTIEETLKDYNSFFQVVPRIVYVSNATETGSLYTKKELSSLYRYTRQKGLLLYIDGARMAQALVAGDVKIEDLSSLCDAVSLGGTKDGALFGEVLLVFSEEISRGMTSYMKQRGVLMAKGFLLGLQFDTLFADDFALYRENAKHALTMARHLVDGWCALGGELASAWETNQIFIAVGEEEAKKIKEAHIVEDSGTLGDKVVLRLVTSYRTTYDDVENFLETAKSLF